MSDIRITNPGCTKCGDRHGTCSCGCPSGNVFTKRLHHKWWTFKKHRGCSKNIFSR